MATGSAAGCPAVTWLYSPQPGTGTTEKVLPVLSSLARRACAC
jgi:hypothetical protein